jgi:glycosyltransferase involved in cell wall biosynthesis
MTVSDYPKLLVATEFPPNTPGGGGAIIRQMLKGWPIEKLFWWSCRPDTSQQYGQRTARHAVASIPSKLYPNKRGRELKGWLLDLLWKPWAEQHFRKALAELQPDVVWVIPHGFSIAPLSNVLLKGRIPCHFSLHDYPDTQTAVSQMGVKRCRQLANQVDRLYKHATSRDTISREMTNDLADRTGAAGNVNHAGLEHEDFNFLSAKPGAQGGSIRIAYAGTIIAEAAFAVFVKALARARSGLSRPLTLEFFGDHSYHSQSWFDSSWMIEHGNLAVDDLSRALKECTWGFMPMEISDDNPRYNRFSLPTKLVSYLASGLPVISFGHPESTVVKMSSQYRVGLCLEENNVDNLSARLIAGLSDADPGTKFRPEIQRCALAEFDAIKIRNSLHENLRKSAQSKVA